MINSRTKEIEEFIISETKKLDVYNFSNIIDDYERQTIKSMEEFYQTPEVQNTIFLICKKYQNLDKDYFNIDSEFTRLNHFRFKNKEFKTFLYNTLLFVCVFYINEISKIEITQVGHDEKSSLFSENVEPMTFYRGQTNAEFTISPSIIRNLNKNIVLNNDSLNYLLISRRLDEKYNSYMRKGATKQLNAYDKFAYLQHAVSYSPLIDLTKVPVIATSFSLSNSNRINEFSNQSCCVFKIKLLNNDKKDYQYINDSDEATKFLKNDFRLSLLYNKLVFGNVYTMNVIDSNGKIVGREEFDCRSLKKMVYDLIPFYTIIDCQTNDRMIYQKGLFLCFHSCTAINGRIFYELNSSIEFEKLIIHPTVKHFLLNKIYKDIRHYDIAHLMDPYLVFNE